MTICDTFSAFAFEAANFLYSSADKATRICFRFSVIKKPRFKRVARRFVDAREVNPFIVSINDF